MWAVFDEKTFGLGLTVYVNPFRQNTEKSRKMLKNEIFMYRFG